MVQWSVSTPRVPSFDGRVAVVTGGGRGIGRAHCRLLAGLGARVVVCDVGASLDGRGRDQRVADSVVAEIRADGGDAVADHSDVSTFAGAASAIARALDAFGRVDIVVNNAGLAHGDTIERVTEDDLARVFAVNYVASIGTIRAAWPSLVGQRWGRIVNTVSEVALDTRVAGGGGLTYGPAKAAVWSATLSLAAYGAPYGITVNAVSPGAATRMNEPMFRETPTDLELDPVHVSRVVAWLVSDDAADVTGRIVHAAAGQHREYTTHRMRDTELVRRIDRAVAEFAR
jgi:NAD(P)-dependent dehydrogenase (short-subunit alcohol dehydrogenase family)